MPYHVQIRRSFRRAWLFNLSEERLGEEILEPWIAGRELELGDQRWEPRKSDLRIIEGPELGAPDLAHGQGWNAAERSGGEDVTRTLLEAAPPPKRIIVLAEGEGTRVLLEASEQPSAEVLEQAAEALRALAAARPA